MKGHEGNVRNQQRRRRAVAVAASVRITDVAMWRARRFIKVKANRPFCRVFMTMAMISLDVEMDGQRHHQHQDHRNANREVAKRLHKDVGERTHLHSSLHDATRCQSLPPS